VGAARAPRDPEALFETILVATDFSEVSADAVRWARGFAQAIGSRCLVAHVVVWPFGPAPSAEEAEGLRKTLLQQAEGDLRRFIDTTSEAGGEVTPVVAVGEPKAEIMAIASAYAVDLIVMGVSGRGAIDRAVLGSTTYGLIRQAECPVLTVRAPLGP
jgi:nucleotide-binding universal stress UspA family protein